jgi:hypothetical protein
MTWWYLLPSPQYLLSGSPAGRKGQVLPGHGAFVSIVIVVGVILKDPLVKCSLYLLRCERCSIPLSVKVWLARIKKDNWSKEKHATMNGPVTSEQH